jgi:hypothetical protein
MDRCRAQHGVEDWLPSLTTSKEVGLEDVPTDAPEINR